MNSSTVSFVAWAIFMVCVLAGFVWVALRSKGVQGRTEDVASKALPEIGGIAERKHTQRFGRAPTGTPGSSNGSRSWYPEVNPKMKKHA